MRRIGRVFLRGIRKNLAKIDDTARSIAKKWDKNTIPLATLKVIVEKSKLSTDDKEFGIVLGEYNQALDRLFKECSRVAKVMDSKSIRCDSIREATAIIYVNFEEGILNANREQ